MWKGQLDRVIGPVVRGDSTTVPENLHSRSFTDELRLRKNYYRLDSMENRL